MTLPRNTVCRHCGRDNRLTSEEKSAQAKARYQAQLLKGAQPRGRPRKFDYGRIRQLRKEGKSMGRICVIMGCEIGTVQHALRNLDPDETPILA